MLGRWDESLVAYDQVVERDGGATAPALRERVARAIYNRGTALRKMGRESEAIAAWDEVVKHYGDSPMPALRDLVAKSRDAIVKKS